MLDDQLARCDLIGRLRRWARADKDDKGEGDPECDVAHGRILTKPALPCATVATSIARRFRRLQQVASLASTDDDNASRCPHPLGTRETASPSPDCAASLRRAIPISTS